jgi:indolepyruvate ferredoxin oxidoreductase, beta subunit
MDEMTTNVLMTGVGGQGILTASAVLSDAALLAGYDVKKSEVHGMSQRGGSVESHVRFSAEQVHSPLIAWGGADVVMALELLEGLRSAYWCRPGGVILVDERRILPSTVVAGGLQYPADCLERLARHAGTTVVVKAFTIARELGEPRAANVVMLGALSEFLPVAEEAYREALGNSIKSKALDINLRAFDLGRAEAGAGE